MDHISLREIIDVCRVEAIVSRISVSEESEWRAFCRYYSENFHTALHIVLVMEPEFVIKHCFEHKLQNVDVLEKMTELMNEVYVIEDPEYEATTSPDLAEFIAKAEADEVARVKAGKPVHKNKNKKFDEASLIPETPKELPPNLPKEGFVNLGYFAKQNKEE